MKAKKLTCMAAVVILAAVTNPAGLSAQEQASAQEHKSKHSHYKVIDLGAFGGPHSTVNSNSVNTNTKGTVVGGASTSTPDPACTFDSHCFVFHAFKYRKNVLTDLGTLPGGTNSFAIAINSRGAIAGISENGAIDPVTGVADFVATVWKNGQIIDLGTLGGSFSLPNAINDRGQAAGGAENTIPDPFNFGSLLGLPSPTQWHATLWQHGSMQDLGTLEDGPDSFAQFVNQRGQAAGISFTNSIVNPETGIPTVDPFFWENGQIVDVGTLGGVFAVLSGLNNLGQVAGTSDVTRDETVFHAFLWERGQLQDLGTFGGDFSFAHWIDDSGEVVGGATTKNNGLLRAARWKSGHMTNLGTLNGDPCSFAVGSNSKGQIIGNAFSGDCDQSHPFLWENSGPMVDLNTLIPPNSGLVLHETQYINERGEITGAAFLPNGDEHAFLLIPCDENHPNTEGCEDAGHDPNAAQSRPEPITSPATTASQPKLTPREMAARSRARLAPVYRGPAITTPASPHNLTASAQNTYQIRLNWQEAWGQNQNGFNIYRCHGCSNPRTQGTKIASVGASALTHTDGSSSDPLTESTTYAYQITAFNGGGESGPSNATSASTMTEPAPTNLSSYAARSGRGDVVFLGWSNNSTDDDSVHIEFCFGSGCTNFSEIRQTGADVTNCTVFFEFDFHKTVRFRVRAHSPGGYSGYSNIRTNTLP